MSNPPPIPGASRDPIPLAYAVPTDASKRRGLSTALAILIGVSLLSILGTWAGVIFVDTEVVLGGGPLIGVLSLATIVLAILARRPLAMVSAVMHLLLCGGVFLLVLLAEWGPRQAQGPMIYIGLGYLAFAVPASVFSFAKASQESGPRV